MQPRNTLNPRQKAELLRLAWAMRVRRRQHLSRLQLKTFQFLRSEVVMLYYAIVFFVIALIAALFGFGGIAAGAAGIAKILFFAFLIIAIVTFLMSLARSR
jgi:uncharacterized membrane protein YtjA (UPF0391 family)